jgi:hypothetical protein
MGLALPLDSVKLGRQVECESSYEHRFYAALELLDIVDHYQERLRRPVPSAFEDALVAAAEDHTVRGVEYAGLLRRFNANHQDMAAVVLRHGLELRSEPSRLRRPTSQEAAQVSAFLSRLQDSMYGAVGTSGFGGMAAAPGRRISDLGSVARLSVIHNISGIPRAAADDVASSGGGPAEWPGHRPAGACGIRRVRLLLSRQDERLRRFPELRHESLVFGVPAGAAGLHSIPFTKEVSMSRQGHIAKKCVRRCAKAGRKCSSRCTRYYYVLDAPPGPDGKRKQTWSKGYGRRNAAEVALREELSPRDQGMSSAPRS